MKRRLGPVLLLVFVAVTASAEPLADAMRDVERIRGLHFTGQVQSVSIARAQLPAQLRNQIEKSLPYSFADYMLILRALRLVPPATEGTEKAMIDLLDEQVLAFYDPLTHVYYAIDGLPAGLPPAAKGVGLEDAVEVHELTHALQDQRFHIGKTDFELRDDSDASLAFHAVVEGEASLVMLAKMLEPLGQTLDTVASNSMLVDSVSSAATMMNGGSAAAAPRYFVESLAVPYTAGLKFIVEVYRHGGWQAVDRIYADPPRSMRDVLHPAEYLAGRRYANVFPLTSNRLVAHPITVEHLGEWNWRFLVGPAASQGWKGDRVTIAQDAWCRPTVLVETEWDSPARAAAFGQAYRTFLGGEQVDAELRVVGNRVFAGYGADDVLVARFIDSETPR